MEAAALADVFRAIAITRTRLFELSARLAAVPGVDESGAQMNVQEYARSNLGKAPEIVVELWAEAEMDDGTGRTWWLESGWYPPRWQLESYLLKDSKEGQEALFEGPVRHVNSAEELAAALAAATDELLALPLTAEILRGNGGKVRR